MFETWNYSDAQRRIIDLLRPSIHLFARDKSFGFDKDGSLIVGGHRIATAAQIADGSWESIYPVAIRRQFSS